MLSSMLGGLGGGAALSQPQMLSGGGAAGERLWTSTKSTSGYKGVRQLPSLKGGTLRFQLNLGPANGHLAWHGGKVALSMGLSSANATFSTAKAAARVYAAIVGPPP